MTAPFIVFGLPRSRTAWLARFLTYGDWFCGHDELRHVRSLDDVKSWLAQPLTGTVETNAAPWWRTLLHYSPDVRVVTVRRPAADVIASMMRVGATFDIPMLTSIIHRLDAKLDQIEHRVPGVLSVTFDDLNREEVCASVFEHCLPYKHDPAQWDALAHRNIQINFPALIRYFIANQPQLDKVRAQAKQQSLARMALTPCEPPEGITFQQERFDPWLLDAKPLFEEHLVQVGETPDGSVQAKNLPLLRQLEALGGLQITTARFNGRMFGYLMTLICPSLEGSDKLVGVDTTFFASRYFPGLGLKLERASIAALKDRGVDELFQRAGPRGSGPRLPALYRRLGAVSDGEIFRLDISET